MTREQWNEFRKKQTELYEKYTDSTDPEAYEKLNQEWTEFISEFHVGKINKPDDAATIRWFEPCNRLPNHSKPILLDCDEGVGEGYYFGHEQFRFLRFGVYVDADNVYRWAEMPKGKHEC